MARRLNPDELQAYDVLPRDLAARVLVQRVPALMPGMSGMTIGRIVLVTSDQDRSGTRTLLAHELVHVRQWHELGRLRFLGRYLSGYARGLARLRSHRRAYRSIDLEIAAYLEAAAWAATHPRRADPSSQRVRGR